MNTSLRSLESESATADHSGSPLGTPGEVVISVTISELGCSETAAVCPPSALPATGFDPISGLLVPLAVGAALLAAGIAARLRAARRGRGAARS